MTVGTGKFITLKYYILLQLFQIVTQVRLEDDSRDREVHIAEGVAGAVAAAAGHQPAGELHPRHRQLGRRGQHHTGLSLVDTVIIPAPDWLRDDILVSDWLIFPGELHQCVDRGGPRW